MSYTKIFIKNNVRILVSDLTDVAIEGLKLKSYLPYNAFILAKAISLFSPLIYLNQKSGKITSFWKSNGLIKNFIVEASYNGDVRAMLGNDQIATEYDDKDFNNIPLFLGLGNEGTLKIINNVNGHQFGGEVKIMRSDLITDLCYFFEMSAQIKTAFVASTHFSSPTQLDRAYSVIFQLLPNATDQDIEWIESFLKTNNLDNLTLEKYIENLDAQFLLEHKLQWKCQCSKTKTKELLFSLPKQEIDDLLIKDQKIEIMCHFCNNKYTFLKEDLNWKK